MAVESSRPTAREIYERVSHDARDELERPAASLAYSGLFAGFTIGAAPLVVALVLATLGSSGGEKLIAYVLYPIGYIAVILGRGQFFTENTLYPVMLSLRDRSALRPTAKLWAIVYSTNLLGAALFALLAVGTAAFGPDVRDEFVQLGLTDVGGGFGSDFWSAVIAGWLLALLAWLVEAAGTAIGQFAVIWAVILIVGLGGFDHCIASTVEVLTATFEGEVGLDRSLGWLATVTLGNVLGGMLIVTALNFGQARARPS